MIMQNASNFNQGNMTGDMGNILTILEWEFKTY
jgi:hypothetical protein